MKATIVSVLIMVSYTGGAGACENEVRRTEPPTAAPACVQAHDLAYRCCRSPLSRACAVAPANPEFKPPGNLNGIDQNALQLADRLAIVTAENYISARVCETYAERAESACGRAPAGNGESSTGSVYRRAASCYTKKGRDAQREAARALGTYRASTRDPLAKEVDVECPDVTVVLPSLGRSVAAEGCRLGRLYSGY